VLCVVGDAGVCAIAALVADAGWRECRQAGVGGGAGFFIERDGIDAC
jgi:hypothetical protein